MSAESPKPPPRKFHSAPAGFGQFEPPTCAPVELQCRVSRAMLVEKLFVLGPPIGAVELYGDDRRLELSERDNPFDPLASPNSWHVAPSAPVRVLRLVIHPPQHEQLEQAPAGHAGVIGLVPSLALDS